MEQCAPSITHKTPGTSGKPPIAIERFTHIAPSGCGSIWQGTHTGWVGSSLLLGRYSNVRAVGELVEEAWFVLMGQSVGVKKSFFRHHHWLVNL